MNVSNVLKALRMRDKDLAGILKVKVAQLNRRQKQIQQPNEENTKQLKDHVLSLITQLQYLIQEPGVDQQGNSDPIIASESETELQETDQQTQETPIAEPIKKVHWKTAEKLARQAQQNKA